VKNYYSILGLPDTASGEAIKRAYRQLALRYHPDKNPSREAEERFKEINAAYAVLGDAASRRAYDGQWLQHKQGVAHRDPKYRRRPTRPTGPTPQQQLYLYMKEYVPYMRKIMWAGLAVCVLLAVDVALPARQSYESIVDMTFEVDNVRKLHLDDGSDVSLSRELARRFNLGNEVIVYRSYLISVPLKVENQRTGQTAAIEATLYHNFAFLPLLLLGLSVAGLFFTRSVEAQFNLGVVAAMMLIFTLLLYLFQ
jgi:hypothetical protein